MNFKIIETSSEYPDVLVFRNRDRDENELVKIMAFGTISEDEDQIAETIIDFPQSEYAIAFVKNFDIELAEIFCQEHNLKY